MGRQSKVEGAKEMTRENTRVVHIGNRTIGGGSPILIQSMTNTRTEDVEATVEQIHRLEQAGCEIIRCTVPTLEAARAVGKIKKQISIPPCCIKVYTIAGQITYYFPDPYRLSPFFREKNFQ